jgi:hypothetical protein
LICDLTGSYLPFEVWLQRHFFLVIATLRPTADLLLVCAAANGNGCPSERVQKYRYQTALTSDRLCLKTDIGHHRSQRYPAGYCRAKNVLKRTFIFNSPGTACRANLSRRLVHRSY